MWHGLLPHVFISYLLCRNPSLGLATKARACKGAGQKGSPRITYHAPESVRDCKGMNPHKAKFKSTKCAKLYWKLWSTPRSLKITKNNMKRMQFFKTPPQSPREAKCKNEEHDCNKISNVQHDWLVYTRI